MNLYTADSNVPIITYVESTVGDYLKLAYQVVQSYLQFI
jgi:hypothetical protein